ncbi:MAG: hypothetical protein QM817_33560 [Archangium sp.]
MRALLAFVVLASTLALAEESKPLRIAVPGLRGVRLSEQELEFYAEHLAQNLRAPGLVVVTSREISTLLGIERQKQLLGCGDGANSCVAELANALGADAVVLGDVARIDDTFQINLELITPSDASVLAQGSRRVSGQVASLDALASLGRELGRGLLTKKGRAVPAELQVQTSAGAAPPRAWSWVPVGAGVAIAGAGALFLSFAEANAAVLRNPTGGALKPSYAAQIRDEGKLFQALGAVFLGVGIAATAAGFGLVLFGPRETPASVSFVPLPGGAAFAFSGALP